MELNLGTLVEAEHWVDVERRADLRFREKLATVSPGSQLHTLLPSLMSVRPNYHFCSRTSSQSNAGNLLIRERVYDCRLRAV
ncbi:hypothetical protein RB195_016528 [Necator americanus]|uniref:Uncharacterized protein n=1 Tax=Necator americanus TaxID=51031 RepID=A0ABR1C3K0_NECAM